MVFGEVFGVAHRHLVLLGDLDRNSAIAVFGQDNRSHLRFNRDAVLISIVCGAFNRQRVARHRLRTECDHIGAVHGHLGLPIGPNLLGSNICKSCGSGE